MAKARLTPTSYVVLGLIEQTPRRATLLARREERDAEARALRPRVVHVDSGNRIVDLGTDPSAPVPGSDQERSPQAVSA